METKEPELNPTTQPQKAELAKQDQVLPPNLFLLPFNGPVVFPTMMAPIHVGLQKSIETVEEAISRQRLIGLVMLKKGELQTEEQEFFQYGTVARIVKRIKMPDGSINLLVYGLKRFKIKKILSNKPHMVSECEYLEDQYQKSDEMDALSRMVISRVKKLAEVNPFFTDEMRLAMLNAPGPGSVADLVAFAIGLPKAEAQEFIQNLDVKDRFEKLLVYLQREQNLADIQKKIQDDVNGKLNSMQREYFLKEQLKIIKKELGLEEDAKTKNSRDFREKIETLGLSEKNKEHALEVLNRFETLSEQSPEYQVERNYLETICALPWQVSTQDVLDLKLAKKILDEDHFGLDKIKERILQFLAVRQLSSSGKGSIICLVGPPGVGKTSIGKSIAKTMGRKFYRFSLGGVRDEAEIKGHRRTYVGAMPGKIIQAMKRAGSANAVLMLDEIDKMGQSYQGDPASALLEVLDPEQNKDFLDHYLDMPFDLSKVLFIATANTTATFPAPLLDRMEVIELPGYTLEEKEKIASQYVIPKVLKTHGIKPNQVTIDQATIRQILNDYSREPGLRSLEKNIESICRAAAIRIVNQTSGPLIIRKDQLQKWLGPKRFYNEVAERHLKPGTAIGMAWTQTGGDILFIEALEVSGTGKLQLTGQMGEVMKESAEIAWSYVKKAVGKKFGSDYFQKRDFHIHIPAGAIPKDGPSAGITMASALYSLITGQIPKPLVSMTGELSLQGNVLPVGGIKEKLLAAKRAGIKKVVLPFANKKDLPEVPRNALKGIKIKWVKRVQDVFKEVLI